MGRGRALIGRSRGCNATMQCVRGPSEQPSSSQWSVVASTG